MTMDGSSSRVLAELKDDLQSLSLLPDGNLYGYTTSSLVTVTVEGIMETLAKMSVCGQVTATKLITPQAEGI